MIKAILFDAIRQNGGSYQMAINNLISIIKNFKKKKIEYIILTHENNLDLDKFRIKYQIIKITKWDYFFLLLRNIKFLNFLLKKLEVESSFEKYLLKNNINLIIFSLISWKSLLLNKINFTTTVLDTCHNDFYGKKKFKEISLIIYMVREYLYKSILPISYRIITESTELKKKIIKLYGLKANSIVSIPNLPSMLFKDIKKINKAKNIRKKYNITKEFYFYPSQFWEHKNHEIILKCIKKFKSKKREVNFIFCGRDKGNLRYIKNKIAEYKIEKNIKILGYVKDDELLELYKICKALVMPSYFGPTNIPPVEAWYLNIPVIYSSLNAKHGLDAAMYFDPESVNQLTKSIENLDNKSLRKKLISKGRNRLRTIKKENIHGHLKFASDIDKFR